MDCLSSDLIVYTVVKHGVVHLIYNLWTVIFRRFHNLNVLRYINSATGVIKVNVNA